MKLKILTPGNNFSVKFMRSWSEMLCELTKHNIDFGWTVGYTSNVYTVRNVLLGGDDNRGKDQLPTPEADYYLFIDSDCVFTSKDVLDLLKLAEENPDKTVITGWCKIEDGFNTPFFRCDGTENEPLKSLQKRNIKINENDHASLDDLHEIKFCGGHFTIIRRDIFNKIDYPWFGPYIYSKYGCDNLYAGEDVSFCYRVREQGGSIWLAKNIKVGHEKLKVLY